MPRRRSESHCLIIADSDVLVRNVLGEYLRHCGYKVIEAANSAEVIAVLQEPSIGVSAILSDAELGGSMNAFELRLWVKQQRPEVQLILAGNAETAAKAAGDLCDEGPHLKRPYDPQAVSTLIRRLLSAARK